VRWPYRGGAAVEPQLPDGRRYNDVAIARRAAGRRRSDYSAQDIEDLHGAVAVALAIQAPEQAPLRGYFRHAGLFL
jgi:hypothetical protein